MAKDPYNKEWLSTFFESTYSNGGVDVRLLPETMLAVYDHTGDRLTGRINTVFKRQSSELRRVVNTNIFRFSAAKTYQEAIMVNSLLFDRAGNKENFSLFKANAEAVMEVTNVNYLKTESRTAAGQARQILRWEQITAQAQTFKSLRYRTVGDKKVRTSHRAIDGIIRPVNDDFWLRYMPKNGWNCRCWVDQVTQAIETEITPDRIRAINADVPEQWRFNAGVEKDVFGPKHPYLQVPKKHAKLKSQNFGFKIPESRI